MSDFMTFGEFVAGMKQVSDYQSRVVKEAPVNNPQAVCQHCAYVMPMNEMVYDAKGRPFCSVGHRTACEIFEEQAAREMSDEWGLG